MTVDARPLDDGGPTDGPPVDAAPVNVTLSQTTSPALVSPASIACGNNADNTTAENSWYRVFRLDDAGVTRDLNVISVSFGVQDAEGQPQVQVKLGTYTGSTQPPPTQLVTTQITPLATTSFTVPNITSTAPMMVNVPISATVPAGSQLVVEVFAPDFAGTGKMFWIGGNTSGESAPSYVRAPSCSIAQPQSVQMVASGAGITPPHLVITVQGSY
ncbi:MAG: hypothetical protein GX539_14975 [Candidatus Cloacimonetes bacterium]|nr:hypothetical protein [Candidatus Cloacimonadota bacterium]